MVTATLWIPGWRPCTVNQLTKQSRHWAHAHRLKAKDRDVVRRAALAYGAAKASGKRRVSLRIAIAGRQQVRDPDSMWKSLLDALVHAGLLVGDDPTGVELGPVVQERGGEPGTEITLTDIG